MNLSNLNSVLTLEIELQCICITFVIHHTIYQTVSSNSVYYSKLPEGEYIYLLLYVDDMLIASKSRSTIDNLKKDLSSEFDMKDLGEAKKVLGIEIERDRKSDKASLT